MIISLCGFMGAGKSTVGKYLSKMTGADFIDLDRYIEQKMQISIADFFTRYGEEAFRKEEFLSLKEIISEYSTNADRDKNLVLSLGGGTVTNNECAQLIKENSYCIYLYCNKNVLVRRVSRSRTFRPVLKEKSGKELERHIDQLMQEREKFYRSCSHIIIDNSSGSIPAVVSAILNLPSKIRHLK